MKKQFCKGCGAEIIWAKTSNGKYTPIDAKEKSFYHISSDGTATLMKGHESHWYTCPNAKDFKKDRKIF
jgi:hypothetical protein